MPVLNKSSSGEWLPLRYVKGVFSFRCRSHHVSIAKRRNSTLYRVSVPPSSYPSCPDNGWTVALHEQPLDVRLTVEQFAAQQDVGDASGVAVVLQRAAAHFQPCAHLLVREVTLPVQQGAALLAEPVEGGKHTVEAPVETEHPFVLMRHQFIHTGFGFSGFTYWNFSNALATVQGILAPVLHHRQDAFHVFGTVIRLVADLAVCQRAVVAQRLQRARADVQHTAHVLIVEPSAHPLLVVVTADFVHPADVCLEFGNHPFKYLSFDTYYFHLAIHY